MEIGREALPTTLPRPLRPLPCQTFLQCLNHLTHPARIQKREAAIF